MKRNRTATMSLLAGALTVCLLAAGCTGGTPGGRTDRETESPAAVSTAAPDAGGEAVSTEEAPAETATAPEETGEAAAGTDGSSEKEAGLTLRQLSDGHGSLVSTTEEPVTPEQLTAIYEAVEAVTLGDDTMWKLSTISGLDLLQELLPTYAQAGLLHEGNVAIIVSCSSDTGTAEQFHVTDNTRIVAAGMVAQQICVAAQMQGIGFKVITDNIRESSYNLYIDNIVDSEHLLQEGKEWEEWLTQFAIPKENYYVMGKERTPVKTIGGDYITLGNGDYTYYETDGESTANKLRTEYVKGYMTPCVVVLLGNTEDEPQQSRNFYEKFVTEYNGEGNPYPEEYGGSGHTDDE